MNKTVPVAVVLVIVIVVIAAVFLYKPSIISKVTTTPSVSTVSIPIAMTDPAEVPANTTSLYISYSSFKVTFFTANASGGIIAVNSSGSIDLLSLVNASKVLAVVNLLPNSFVKSIQFTVVSANATINGTTYNVEVPNPIVTAAVSANFNKINSSSSLVLDFTPALITVYTANSTEYVLVPSLLALSSTGISKSIGSIAKIPANINRTFFAARPNITITSATLQQIGNLTKISVTVKDNSNQSVILQHLRLKMTNGFGVSMFNFSQNVLNDTKINVRKHLFNISNEMSDIKARLPSFISNLNDSIYSNLSSINLSVKGGLGNIPSGSRGTGGLNVGGAFSKFGNMGSSMQEQFTNIQNQMNQNFVANQNRVNIMNRILAGMSINFFISSNGTLFLPFSGHQLFNLPFNVTSARVNRINMTDMNITYNQSGFSQDIVNNSSFSLPANFGYTLLPSSSVTLTFSGEMNVGDGLVSLALLPGVTYNLYLQGTGGAFAFYTVNATS